MKIAVLDLGYVGVSTALLSLYNEATIADNKASRARNPLNLAVITDPQAAVRGVDFVVIGKGMAGDQGIQPC